MKKLISVLVLLMLICIKSYSQSREIIYIKIDTIGLRQNEAGNKMELSYTPGAMAVLNLEKSEFSVLFSNEIVYYKIAVEQDSTEILNPKTVLNRKIVMNGVDSEGNTGLIIIFFGTKTHVLESVIINKEKTISYSGRVIEDSLGNL